MAEVTLKRVELWETWEQGYIGQGRVCHGLFTDQGEAVARYHALAQRQPHLAQQGALGVDRRTVEVLEAAATAQGTRP